MNKELLNFLYGLRDSKQHVDITLVTGCTIHGTIRNVYDASFIVVNSDEFSQHLINLNHVVKVSYLA